MSFGGGFGGFGQNNNNQTSGTFGSFGSNTNNNNSPGFGSNGGAFGSNANTNTGGGMFGNNANNNTTGGFGSTAGAFGSNNGAFGAKPAFGSTPTTTTGSGLFGAANNNTATTSSFGGAFGANNNNTTSAFGASNTTGSGMFGNNANKPGFGTTNTSTSLFGGTSNNTTANTGSSFGGFGANNKPAGDGDPPGTGGTPFQAFNEKEANTSLSNAFQNICFQSPYMNWSAEELRMVDYLQGRRHGNASGTGAFGVSTGFGGFSGGNNTTTNATSGFGATNTNNTGGGLFGSNNNTTNTTSAFGTGAFGQNNNNTGGGLFGNNNNAADQNKPAGGLFGNTNTQTTGGLFGNTNNNAGGTGFGSNNTAGGVFGGTTNNAGGGLFGNNNQAKPAGTGFSFGNANTNNNTATTSAFGSGTGGAFGSTNTNTSGGGLFGNNTNTAGGGLFGNNANTNNAQAGGGLFANNNNQQQSGGLFGNNQQKPASGGLFGSTPTNTNSGGGLFGNNNQQSTAFGGAAANSGGLFGAKPAATGGLFGGNPAAQNNAGGGLFGGLGANNQGQQSTGTGLFGGAANNQQKPSLFGSSTAAPGGGLFGGQTNQIQGSGLFGASTNQQQSNAGLGSSLLGNSQQASVAPQGLTANLNDISAYGSPSLFSGLAGNEAPNPGPLAVPLNSEPKPRRPGIFPIHKFTPGASSRFGTPQKRGFGFSYSSYGTPTASPSGSTNTPASLGRSLLAPAGGNNLSRSVSSSNLRRSYNTEDSILLPGAFSNANTRWYGSTGSKKLVINRDLRSDLFSTPQKDKQAGDANNGTRKLSKRVSFDTSVESEEATPPRAALPAPSDVPSSPSETTPRQNKPTVVVNGSKSPEMEQVKELQELTIVHEEATPEPQANGFDNAPGTYWMEPSREELQNMNRVQRQKINDFTVGRDNVGSITFKIPVDISGIDLDELCGGIIQLEPRSATVYPIAAKKPPVGKGLNVPARISLEQSWPRGGRDKRITSDPKRFNKHIERLKRIVDTTFESYDVDTGVWVFSVEHFTTYGLDDSDDETDGDISAAPGVSAPLPSLPQDMSIDSATPMRAVSDAAHRRGLPGSFDEQGEFYAEEQTRPQSFLGVSSADSATHDVRLSLEDDYANDSAAEYDLSEDEYMTRSFVGQHPAAEQDDSSSDGGQDAKRGTPGGILRARMRAVKDSIGPVKLEVADGDDWMEMLWKTVSPVKRDRQLLRGMNDAASKPSVRFEDDEEPEFRKSSIWGKSMAKPDRAESFAASTQIGMDQGRGFATSIDLMNSLFEKPRPKAGRQSLRASQSSKGFPKWPYERQDKILSADKSEQEFHNASRPTWGPDETLVLTRSLDAAQSRRSTRDMSDILSFQRSGIQTETQDVRLAKFNSESSQKYLSAQDALTEIDVVDGVPCARLRPTSLKLLFHHKDMSEAASIHEKQVWELASILFDNLDASSLREQAEPLARKAKLSQFWTELVEQATTAAIGLAATSEEKAVACLAGHCIPEACKYLLDGKNFRLGTLVPLIGTSDAAKKDMKEQVKAWHDSKILSEYTEAIRTIYELLSGNVCVCEGLKHVPVEDRLESFVISKKFGLDWRQSFGLRLWYAISKHDDLSVAVKQFKEDIEQDREDLPQPWYLQQGVGLLWDDAKIDSRQDLLWGLLQLYSDSSADLEAILGPENFQLSPLNFRLRWQLGLALTSTGIVSYGANGREKADAATISYAAQLASAGDWLEAIFVLLHLHQATARKRAIQELLCRHAGLIGSESSAAFTVLTEKYRIPSAWVWEALALYMRSVKKDASAEVQCLIRAGSFVEAHSVLTKQVAPQAIIERDYAKLRTLMSQFQERQLVISDWALGGEIYVLFLQLIQHRATGEGLPSGLLDKLLAGLNAMKEEGSESDILRYAAISDMADETAREIVKSTKLKQDAELRSRILNLPLTQDRLLAYSVDLSLDRYKEVMSH